MATLTRRYFGRSAAAIGLSAIAGHGAEHRTARMWVGSTERLQRVSEQPADCWNLWRLGSPERARAVCSIEKWFRDASASRLPSDSRSSTTRARQSRQRSRRREPRRSTTAQALRPLPTAN